MNPPETSRPAINLRPITPADLPTLYEIQTDPESNEMAGTKPRGREAFFAIWASHFANPAINPRVIEISGTAGPEIAGSISRFPADGLDCVGYWIARQHWGRGIASRALAAFLLEDPAARCTPPRRGATGPRSTF